MLKKDFFQSEVKLKFNAKNYFSDINVKNVITVGKIGEGKEVLFKDLTSRELELRRLFQVKNGKIVKEVSVDGLPTKYTIYDSQIQIPQDVLSVEEVLLCSASGVINQYLITFQNYVILLLDIPCLQSDDVSLFAFLNGVIAVIDKKTINHIANYKNSLKYVSDFTLTDFNVLNRHLYLIEYPFIDEELSASRINLLTSNKLIHQTNYCLANNLISLEAILTDNCSQFSVVTHKNCVFMFELNLNEFELLNFLNGLISATMFFEGRCIYG